MCSFLSSLFLPENIEAGQARSNTREKPNGGEASRCSLVLPDIHRMLAKKKSPVMAPLEKDIYKLVMTQLNRKYPDYASRRELIEEAFYWERLRLRRKKRGKRAESRFYRRLQRDYIIDENQVNRIFRALIKNHLREIQGNFSNRLFALARRLLTAGLRFLINEVRPLQMLFRRQALPPVEDKIFVAGAIDSTRKLAANHTLVMVPNHVSNFDSVVLGFGLQAVGLPPFFYGAGLNLFTNPLLSFMMNNLGAYKVDREKRHQLYKEILKAYSIAMLQQGRHSLFFPGGTRLRSGGIEKNLKLGLLGTAVTAFANSLLGEAPARPIAIVPVSINYQVVMEAQGLIRDHLAQTGKEHYLGDPPALRRPKTLLKKIGALLRLDTEVYIHVCPPMDVLGHNLDAQGRSQADIGLPVDTKRYFWENGQAVIDANRDAVYTSFLARSITKTYQNHNLVTASNVLCYAVWWFKQRQFEAAHSDLSFLYLDSRELRLEKRELFQVMKKVLRELQRLTTHNQLLMAPALAAAGVDEVYRQTIDKLARFHYPPPVHLVGSELHIGNTALIMYYANRLRAVRGFSDALQAGDEADDAA
jgi:glycerol-3-phosphate O-acyltransferase